MEKSSYRFVENLLILGFSLLCCIYVLSFELLIYKMIYRIMSQDTLNDPPQELI